MRCMFYLIGITTTPYDKIHSKQDTFKKIKAIDSIKLDAGNKLHKFKILLSDGSLKSLNIFGK